MHLLVPPFTQINNFAELVAVMCLSLLRILSTLLISSHEKIWTHSSLELLRTKPLVILRNSSSLESAECILIQCPTLKSHCIRDNRPFVLCEHWTTASIFPPRCMPFLPDCLIGLLSPFSAQPSIQTSQIDLSFLLSLILSFFLKQSLFKLCACMCMCMRMHAHIAYVPGY